MRYLGRCRLFRGRFVVGLDEDLDLKRSRRLLDMSERPISLPYMERFLGIAEFFADRLLLYCSLKLSFRTITDIEGKIEAVQQSTVLAPAVYGSGAGNY